MTPIGNFKHRTKLLFLPPIDLNAKNKCGVTGFHLAFIQGQDKIEEMLVTKSFEFNIDVNVKCNLDNAFLNNAFQSACKYGDSKMADMLIQKSTEFNIKLNAGDEQGRTGFLKDFLIFWAGYQKLELSVFQNQFLG